MFSGVVDRVQVVFCGAGKHNWKSIYRLQCVSTGYKGFHFAPGMDWKIVGSKCRRCGHEVRL